MIIIMMTIPAQDFHRAHEQHSPTWLDQDSQLLGPGIYHIGDRHIWTRIPSPLNRHRISPLDPHILDDITIGYSHSSLRGWWQGWSSWFSWSSWLLWSSPITFAWLKCLSSSCCRAEARPDHHRDHDHDDHYDHDHHYDQLIMIIMIITHHLCMVEMFVKFLLQGRGKVGQIWLPQLGDLL